ncbi:MAG: caspase family protein, partial [Spirochaetia bacterium]
VVFYYAGHGGSIKTEDTSDESLPNDAINEFIYPADSLGPGIVEDNFITDDQLGTSFQNNLSHTQNVLILDSCNSGGFISTRDTGWDHRPDDATSGTYVMGDVEPPAFMAMNLYFANLPDSDISDNNTLVLTSAGQLEEAPESALYNHGVFTYYLLETPITADANSDGFITVLEAFEHIDYRMRTEWNEYYSHPLNRNLPHVTVSPLDYVLFEAD